MIIAMRAQGELEAGEANAGWRCNGNSLALSYDQGSPAKVSCEKTESDAKEDLRVGVKPQGKALQ